MLGNDVIHYYRCGIALALDETSHLEATVEVIGFQRGKPAVRKAGLRDAPSGIYENRPTTRLSAQSREIFGATVCRRTLDLEHCTHGINSPVSRVHAIWAVLCVMSSLVSRRS